MFKFHTKLIALCSIVGIAPLLILGLLTYNISNSIEDDLISANKQVLFETERRVEATLKLVDNSMIQLINTPTIYRLISSPRNENYYSQFRDAASLMYGIQTFETEVSDMLLISNLQGWIISNTLMNNISDIGLTAFIDKLNSIPKTSFWFNTSNIQNEDLNKKIVKTSGVFLVKKIPVNTVNSDGLAIIEFPTYYINKLIAEESMKNKILILDEEGLVIPSDNSLFTNGYNAFQPQLSMITTDPVGKGYFLDKLDNQDYMVVYDRSQYNNWTYISFTPASQVFYKSIYIKNTTLVIGAVMFILIILLALKGSQGLYSPVRKLYKLTQDNVDASGKSKQAKDELKVINENIENLISINKKYKIEIAEQSDTVKLFFFRRLLQGEIEKKQIKKNLDKYSVLYHYESFAILGIKADSLENTYFHDDKELLLFSIGNILSDLIDCSKGWIPVLLKDEYFVLLLSNETQSAFREDIGKIIHNIQDALSTYLGVSTSVGVSSLYENIEQITLAKAECVEALKYCVKSGSGSVTFTDVVKTSRFINSITISDKKNELLLAIKSGKAEEAERFFDLCLSEIIASELEINIFQFEVISLAIDVVKTIQVIDNDFNFNIESFLSKFNSMDEMTGYIKLELIFIGCSKYNYYRLNVKRTVLEQIMEYINMNLLSDISLDSCARHLNYSANYISRIFKSENSIAFSDYVALRKIDVVKDMLVNTSYSITEISKKMSYNNPQNFIRSFKKVTGVTPGQYRISKIEET